MRKNPTSSIRAFSKTAQITVTQPLKSSLTPAIALIVDASNYGKKAVLSVNSTSKMNKPTHGGARKGAGRKPPDSPKIRKNIYLSLTEWLYLQSLDTSPSRAIRQLIKEKQK
jgi:hypothetical protein